MATLNVDPVSPTRAYQIAKACLQHRTAPCFFHGKPGIGKSDLVMQLADEFNMKLEILMLTQIDAQDLRGIQYPDPITKRMVYYPPEFLPGQDSPPTLLFLDELTGAEPRLQVSAYQLLLSRRIGSYHLPDSCLVCAAGNSTADGAVAYEMGTALASRLLHIAVQAEPRSWLSWASVNNMHPSVMSLIQLKGNLLEDTDKQLEQGNLIGPNPRAWAQVSGILHKVGIGNRELAEPMVEGLIGRSAAAELFLHAQEMSNVPSAEVLMGMPPMQAAAMVPRTIPALYGIVFSLVAYSDTVEHMQRTLGIMNALPTTHTGLPAGDCVALAMELIFEKADRTHLTGELMKTAEFIENVGKIQDIRDIATATTSMKDKRKNDAKKLAKA